MVVYISVCEAVFIIVGNSLTIYIFWGIRKQLKRTSYLLINLAFADLLVGIALSLWISDGFAAMMEVRLSYTVFGSDFNNRCPWSCNVRAFIDCDLFRENAGHCEAVSTPNAKNVALPSCHCKYLDSIIFKRRRKREYWGSLQLCHSCYRNRFHSNHKNSIFNDMDLNKTQPVSS